MLNMLYPQTLLHPFHLDEAHPLCTYQPSKQNIPQNPTSSSLHSCWTSMLIAILRQFRYPWPLLPITGNIPGRINCSTPVCFSVLTNCLCFLSMIFSTLSVTTSILAPGKQITISSPLSVSVGLPNYRVPHKHHRSPPHPLCLNLRVALMSDLFRQLVVVSSVIK